MERVLTSLAIMTYNRAAMLASALKSVAASRVERPGDVEVIVVDNNSTDRTRQTVEEIRAADFPFSLRYVLEKQQGVAYARNRGIEESAGIYLAFMDDDQLLDDLYLSRIVPAFSSTGAACVGGRIFYYKNESLPDWLPPLLQYVGQCDFGDDVITLDARHSKLHAGNMAFERQELIDIGRFNVSLGRCGDSLLAGEEDELQTRLHAAGKKVVYDPGLVQYHYLAQARRTKRYWRRHYFDYGRTLYRTQLLEKKMPELPSFFGVPRWFWRHLLTRELPRAARPLVRLDLAQAFYKQLDLWSYLGQMYEAHHDSQRLAR